MEALLGYEMVQVACGASHVLALSTERELFAWGRGDGGKLSSLFQLLARSQHPSHDLVPSYSPSTPWSVFSFSIFFSDSIFFFSLTNLYCTPTMYVLTLC